MRILPVLLLFCFASCRFISEQEKYSEDLSGNWLVLYADHKLKNEKQRQIYGRIQDSVIGDRGLKLVSFSGDGGFRQMDEPAVKGKWVVSPEGKLYVVKGGAGFNVFEADIQGYEKQELRLAEYIRAEGETIGLVWHLKKVTDASLFKAQNNSWRQQPSRAETDQQLKKRLASMLRYYSDYYMLVQKEASYFIGDRVMLPFRYYQHAMAMQPFNPGSGFARLFYNAAQAEQAYAYLAQTMDRLGNKFPYKSNFVEEYAAFMGMMARGVTDIK